MQGEKRILNLNYLLFIIFKYFVSIIQVVKFSKLTTREIEHGAIELDKEDSRSNLIVETWKALRFTNEDLEFLKDEASTQGQGLPIPESRLLSPKSIYYLDFS